MGGLMKGLSVIILIFLLGGARSVGFSLWLDTGGRLSFLSPQEVKEDWEEGFKEEELILKRYGKIWDYMDGEEGFSEWEKGYWISHYGKTSNIRDRLKTRRRDRDKMMYEMYYLQKIILDSRGGVQFFLYDLLEELREILGDFEDMRNIRKIRIRSGEEHLRMELGDIFGELSEEEQSLLGEYRIQRTEFTKRKLLKYYKDRKSDYEWKKKNLNRLLEEKRVLEVEWEGEDMGEVLGIDEEEKRKEVREEEKKLNIFFILFKRLSGLEGFLMLND